MSRVAVIGNTSIDVIDGRHLGGGPYYTARGLRLTGAPAVLATKVGAGEEDELMPSLRALGFPVAWRRDTATSTFAISYHGDDRVMTVEAVGDPWRPDDVEGWVAEALGDVEWVHLAPLFRPDFPADTLAALERGRRLSFDGQGLVRERALGRLVLDDDFDPKVLGHVSVLKLSEEEARIVLPDVSAAAVARLDVPEVIVTLGSRGSIVFAEGRREHVPTHPLDIPNPTGAGDSYAAGYLAARADGATPWDAARRATEVALAIISGANSL